MPNTLMGFRSIATEIGLAYITALIEKVDGEASSAAFIMRCSFQR